MQILRPFLALYRRHFWRLSLGVILAILALLASVGLLTLSGWFLSASALAGLTGLAGFNYMLPAAGVRAAAISRTAARYFERLVSHDGTFRVLQHLRTFTFLKLLPLSPAGIRHYRQGELLNRFVADVDTLDHLYLRIISPLLGGLVVIVLVTTGLSWLDVSLALTLGGIMLFTLILLPPIFYYAGKRSGQQITHLRGHYRSQLIRWLQGQAELMVYGQQQAYRQTINTTELAWQRAQKQQASLSGLSLGLIQLISGISATLLLWLSAGHDFSGELSSALIALFVFCSLAAFEALAPVAAAFQHLGHVLASARRVNEITTQKSVVAFLSPQDPACCIAKTPSLNIRNVVFCYPQKITPALNNVDITIAAGQRVALLGRTGCGKTTLLQLITRAWDPQQGTIQIGGCDLRHWPESDLRAQISVVSQRVHLFNRTLRDNLLLAAPQSTDEQLGHILSQVGLNKLLHNAEGLNAWLGEGGRQLSGGELRRLSIARALLHNGAIMLLDEPTEGLDAETEAQILTLLNQLTIGKTVIMVTHRLHGLEKMDNIYLMDQGKIVEQGHHSDLITSGGLYWQFHQHQNWFA